MRLAVARLAFQHLLAVAVKGVLLVLVVAVRFQVLTSLRAGSQFFFPFRSLLVHERFGLAGFRDLSEKFFCRSYLAPFVSFGLTGRNETGRGAAAHAQAQAVTGTGFVGYEPQYIKSEP